MESTDGSLSLDYQLSDSVKFALLQSNIIQVDPPEVFQVLSQADEDAMMEAEKTDAEAIVKAANAAHGLERPDHDATSLPLDKMMVYFSEIEEKMYTRCADLRSSLISHQARSGSPQAAIPKSRAWLEAHLRFQVGIVHFTAFMAMRRRFVEKKLAGDHRNEAKKADASDIQNKD